MAERTLLCRRRNECGRGGPDMQTGACQVSLPAVFLSSTPYAPTHRADMRSADVLLVLAGERAAQCFARRHQSSPQGPEARRALRPNLITPARCSSIIPSHPINLTRAVRRAGGFECVRWITKLSIANSTCPLRLAVRSPPRLQHTSRPPHIPRRVNSCTRIHRPGSSNQVLLHRFHMPSSTRPMASPVGIRPWVASRPTP